MSQEEDDTPSLSDAALVKMTARLVASYVGQNTLATDQLPDLIRSVHGSLKSVETASAPETEEPPKPAVPIKKSIAPDYLICLEDGKKLKMLKRHLRANYGLSPEEYRARWGLPPDYPMVAPNYAAQRSAFAREIGLGRTGLGRTGRGEDAGGSTETGDGDSAGQ